mmetsp:Transcript_31382/g.67777  ORF Transcript_31382/g.67777 Transcript_31382/m.67777 type:complete len:212 (-) Transcript_31382:1308-1943(-)
MVFAFTTRDNVQEFTTLSVNVKFRTDRPAAGAVQTGTGPRALLAPLPTAAVPPVGSRPVPPWSFPTRRVSSGQRAVAPDCCSPGRPARVEVLVVLHLGRVFVARLKVPPGILQPKIVTSLLTLPLPLATPKTPGELRRVGVRESRCGVSEDLAGTQTLSIAPERRCAFDMQTYLRANLPHPQPARRPHSSNPDTQGHPLKTLCSVSPAVAP